jgi:predicted nucleotidyltransferase
MVEFEAGTGEGYADGYFGLPESLEELFERPVDLIVASAIKNPYFLESVEKTRALLCVAVQRTECVSEGTRR